MKNYKILLISFVLLIFMIGAVSAADDNSDVTAVASNDESAIGIDAIDDSVAPILGDSTVNTKDIYVNDTGDDSNTGSVQSPYATINKAISDVNSSVATTIHLSEGTFASDDDSSLQINFNHRVDGGSLTIVGAGPDKTYIDGQAAFRFASIVGSNVTLKDISFIYFNQWNGAAITLANGDLTIDNCVFREIYAKSYQGAISAVGNTAVLTVKDSQFINCSNNGQSSWNSGGAAIYVNNIASLNLINNVFINNTIASGNGVAIYSSNSKTYIDGNKFINLTGNAATDASIYINSQDATICNNEFINCYTPSTTNSIINIGGGTCNLKNNIFTNSSNSVGNIYAQGSVPGLNFTMLDKVISVGNDEVNKGVDVEVFSTDDMGNIVKTTNFNLNFVNDKNSYTFMPSIVNGNYHINFATVPEVGIYNVTVTSGGTTSDVLTTADVHCSSDPADLYVSPEGNDTNNGTIDSPFATIQHALDTGFEKTFNVRVHLLEGTYSGEGNVGLTISNKGSVQLIGEKYNKTIIDGEGENSFIYSTTPLLIKNLTFTNGYSDYIVLGGPMGSNEVSLEDCIIDKNSADYYILSGVNMNNVVYTNNVGSSELYGEGFIVNNSYFANNNNPYGACGALWVYSGTIVENCRFINNSASTKAGALGGYDFVCKNNYFEGNSATSYGAIQLARGASMTLENCTFVNNRADSNGVFGYDMDRLEAYETAALTFNNCKFINNSAINAGVTTLKIGIFNDCLFENNTADYGGAFVLLPYCFEPEEPAYIDEENDEIMTSLEFNNVVFKNNIAKVNGNDIYLGEKIGYYWDEDSAYFYAIPLTITFNDKNVSSLKDDLTATVYGPNNIGVGSAYGLTFLLDGNKIGTGNIVNGVATVTYDGFEDGEYNLSGNSYLPSPENIVNNATVKVKLENVSDSIEFWVSPEGSDESGNGSESNPFNSLSHTVSEAMKKSRNVLIHLTEGKFIGDLNSNLTLPGSFNIALIGAGMDKTIIDGNNSSYFAKITEGKYPINVGDLTITNMLPVNVEDVFNYPPGSQYSMVYNLQQFLDKGISPITVLEGGALNLNNVNISNNRGGKAIIENYGNLVVNNSIFDKNGFVGIGLIIGHITSIDNTLFTSNFATDNLLSSDLLVINNSEFKNNFNFYGYSFTNGGRSYLDAVDVLTIIQNTKVSNDGDNSSLKLLGLNEISTKLAPSFSLNRNTTAINISMVNEFKSPCPEYTINTHRDGARLSAIGWIWGAGGKYVNVYNSTFKNFQYLLSNTAYFNSAYNFDGCVFDNLSVIGAFAAYPNYYYDPIITYNISNSVFLNTPLVIDRAIQQSYEPNMTLDNNYWGSNDKPVIVYKNVEGTFEPTTWIALYSEDEQTVIKNVTDGENSTAYLGNAPIRTDYADNKGALDYAVVFGPVGYLFTTDDDKNVIFNPEDAMYPFVAADPMDYRTPTVIAIAGFEGDLIIVGVLADIVGNPIANATITSTFGNMAPVNTTTDANGTFKVKAGKDGILNVAYAGDDTYFDAEANMTFTNAGKTAKTFININAVDGDFTVSGVLVDDEGIPIANAVINAIVNGNTTINTTTDANGAFNVQGESSSIIDILFAGDDVFDPANAIVELKGLAPARAASVINATDYTTYAVDYYDGERGNYFKVQLLDQNNNPLANKTVKIGFNGVVYDVITNETGWAKLQINLKNMGTYTFAIAFLGDDDYNASFTVQKIIVNKKKTSISASAKTYKASAKTKKYTVTLKTDKGSSIDGKTYMKSGKKVTLTLNGKTYTAKTNSKGQATFSLKITKKGNFNASIKYAGDTTYNAASKTAKIKIN